MLDKQWGESLNITLLPQYMPPSECSAQEFVSISEKKILEVSSGLGNCSIPWAVQINQAFLSRIINQAIIYIIHDRLTKLSHLVWKYVGIAHGLLHLYANCKHTPICLRNAELHSTAWQLCKVLLILRPNMVIFYGFARTQSPEM